MADGFIAVFERREKKYLLNAEQFAALMKRLNGVMRLDGYGLHTINNVYLDDDNFSLIRRSLEKPKYKEKLRLRLYGTYNENSSVFIEIKKKFNGVVYKRREEMSVSEAREYIKSGESGKNGQIFKEIDYAMRLYKPKPKMFIAYDRRAYYCERDPELRITFDSGIRFRTVGLDFALGDGGRYILPKDAVLMEVKISGAFPVWLANIFSEIGVFSSSFSKYGECYKLVIKERKENNNEERSVKYA